VTVYVSLGAAADAARLDAAFRARGIRRGPRAKHRQARSGWDSLTPTEIKIAAFVAEGLSNPEIAVKLVLSRRTVAIHVSHILKKLDVHTRTDIARELALRTLAPRLTAHLAVPGRRVGRPELLSTTQSSGTRRCAPVGSAPSRMLRKRLEAIHADLEPPILLKAAHVRAVAGWRAGVEDGRVDRIENDPGSCGRADGLQPQVVPGGGQTAGIKLTKLRIAIKAGVFVARLVEGFTLLEVSVRAGGVCTIFGQRRILLWLWKAREAVEAREGVVT
jgi:DNA-binding CsgD family transcriptional regulator